MTSPSENQPVAAHSPDALRITVALITYLRPDELNLTLENLLAQQRLPDEIFVLDNDPAGSGRQAPLTAHPLVVYHCAERNLGVAAGRNLATSLAHGDLVVFLDDDAHFAHATAMTAISDAFARPEVACVAFLIRNAATGEIVSREYPGFHPERWAAPHDVSYFLGGASAVRRAVFMELGGLDETLFYIGEELEFSYRLLDAGWVLHYTPTVEVLHREAPHGRESTKNAYWLVRNRIYTGVKHLPFPYLLSYLAIWTGFALLKALAGRELASFLRGLRSLRADGLLQRAQAYRRAHPMTRQTLIYLKAHEGRLLY